MSLRVIVGPEAEADILEAALFGMKAANSV